MTIRKKKDKVYMKILLTIFIFGRVEHFKLPLKLFILSLYLRPTHFSFLIFSNIFNILM